MSAVIDPKQTNKPSVSRSSLDSSLAEATVTCRVSVPMSVFRDAEARAMKEGVDVSEILKRDLVSSDFAVPASAGAGRPINLSPEQRQEIERAFSRPFKDANELVQFLLAVYSVRVDGETIQLSPDLLRRLDGRRGRIPLNAYVAENVVRQLEHIAGMR